MKPRQTHLGTTPSGKKVYLERLPSEYPRFSAEDHSYAAVIHGANRTDGGKRAEQHREAARGKLRSLSRASGRIGKQGKLPDNYEVVETVDGTWMILINGFQTGADVDRSGAGSDTYPTYAEAYKAALAIASGKSHATRRGRSHATVAGAGTGKPSKEQLQQAAKWIRKELNKRDDGRSHPSHLAAKVLEEADAKFQLGSYGVEGWAKSPSIGYQYLNYGDTYDPTIVIRSNPTRATVIVALGGWGSYA